MIDFDKILKIVAVMVVLLAVLLFSGGIWEVKEVGSSLIRVNKITGSVQYMSYVQEAEWKSIK